MTTEFPYALITPTDAELETEHYEQALEERDARIAYLRQRVAELERERDAAESKLADAETDMRALSRHVVKLRDEREAEVETRMWTARQIDVLRIAAERCVLARRDGELATLMAAGLLVDAVLTLSRGTRSQMARGDVDDAEGAAAEAMASMQAAANDNEVMR